MTLSPSLPTRYVYIALRWSTIGARCIEASSENRQASTESESEKILVYTNLVMTADAPRVSMRAAIGGEAACAGRRCDAVGGEDQAGRQ